MTREEALERILSTDTETRLEAARFFSTEAQPDDITLLRQVDKVETVPWIQRALRIACERLSSPVHPAVETASRDEPLETDASTYSKVLRDVSSRILHEIAPLIGGLLAAAPEEVRDYESSQTKLLIEHLSVRSEALRSIRTATGTPKFEEFDLSRFVGEVIASQANAESVQIIITGAEQFLVSADKAQFGMAFSNGLRNAIEAVSGKPEGERAQIVISWGYTAHENWLFVKDNGRGLEHPPAELLKDGISSKAGHSGYGLTLAREAMMSMQGEILLRSEEEGAHFELRWYRKNEDTVR